MRESVMKDGDVVSESDDCTLEWERVFLQFQKVRAERHDAYGSSTSLVKEFAHDIKRSTPYVWRVVRAGEFYLEYKWRHPEAPSLQNVSVGDEVIAYIARVAGSADEADSLMTMALRDGLSKTEVMSLAGMKDRSGRSMRGASPAEGKLLTNKRELLSLVEPSKLVPAIIQDGGGLARALKSIDHSYRSSIIWTKSYDIPVERGLVLDSVVAIGAREQSAPSKVYLVAVDVFVEGDYEWREGIEALGLCVRRRLCDAAYALCAPSVLEGEGGEAIRGESGVGILSSGDNGSLNIARPFRSEESERIDRAPLLAEIALSKSSRISRRRFHSFIEQTAY